ncbi:MAG TPA: zinc-dependent alcohol dehydrogenase family protein [Trueperaceae bacterium]
MTAARILAPNQVAVERLELPKPAAGEVLIEVARAGVCGTDIHILRGQYELARLPVTPGHEFAGTVVAVGEGVLRRRVGDRVTVDPNVACLTCDECLRGAFNQCVDLQAIGVTRDGAFARYLVAPERSVYPIGDLSFEVAALIEPLACVAWGLCRLTLPSGYSALIYGAGPMGCLLLQALRTAGAVRVAMVDVVESRLAIAKELGADAALTPDEARRLDTFAPSGFELVVDATGVPSVLEAAMARVRPAGTIWVFGVAPEVSRISVSPYQLFRRDLTLMGSFAVNRTFPEAISLIRSGAVRTEPLISHVLPIEEFREGLEVAQHDPSRMKVQFSLDGTR